MKLGPLTLENRYILAPMLNVTTAPYRRFCRKFQKIGLVSVPMLYTKRIEKEPKSVEKELYKIEEERPISVQLIGSDPNALRKTIEYLNSYKFDILDLNAGCPSKRAIKAQEGGYLMKDLEKLRVLINTAVKYSSRPISLKIRTGFEKPVNIKKLTQIINESGIDLLIIHARTVLSKYYNGTLDLNTVKELKERLIIPVVGNGDIINPISAKNFIDYTNVDAFMIGRESMGNPEIFNQIHEYLVNKKVVLFKNHRETIEKYINIYEDTLDSFLNGISFPISNELIKFIELKRNTIWLTKNIRNSSKFRIQVSRTKNFNQLKNILEDIFTYN
ncbi:MAG: tRNA-dihydrouridine synthase family protein [Promethearchaeota archaeon]|nr:MAG: tRNA-dihydrouridine synthase family protein [Candidatus Lokiarchaeota archaeon]